MSLRDYVLNILSQWIDQWLDETGKVWGDFVDELGDIWTITPVDLLNPGFYLSGLALKLVDTLDAVQELSQDMALVPSRIAVDVVDDAIPVPKKWRGRAMRADQAVRFFVREALEFAVDIVDLDMPAIVDVLKAGKLKVTVDNVRAKGQTLVQRFETIKAAGKFNVVFAIILLLGNLIKWGAVLVLVLWVVSVLIRIHDDTEGEAILRERAMSQNSRRVRTNLGVRQHRENEHTGDD